MWKDKQGKNVSTKEFFQRWKDGMTKVTPLQQINLQLKSMYLILIGIVAGTVISIIAIKSLWWLTLILLGGLVNALVQFLGMWQKKKMLEKFSVFSLDEKLSSIKLEGGNEDGT